MKHTKKRTERQRKKWALIGLAFFLVATVLICWQVGLPMVRLASDPENFRQWLEERKLGGLLIYGAMVFFQVLFAVIPGEPLEIAGGYAFGAVWGTLVCLVAATLGSLLVFGLVRRFGTRLVEVIFSRGKAPCRPIFTELSQAYHSLPGDFYDSRDAKGSPVLFCRVNRHQISCISAGLLPGPTAFGGNLHGWRGCAGNPGLSICRRSFSGYLPDQRGRPVVLPSDL